MRVEALSQAPTDYFVQAEPTLVDGVLFESVEPTSVTIPPAAASVTPITLRVRSRTGEISGKFNPPLAAISVRAISVADGASFSTQTSAQGAFAFTNLPIAENRVLADERKLAQQGYASAPQTIDLTQMYSGAITLPLVEIARGVELQGGVHAAAGAPLPIAWVTIERAGVVQSNVPDTGTFSIGDLLRESVSLVVSAPGYFSQARAVEVGATLNADFALTR